MRAFNSEEKNLACPIAVPQFLAPDLLGSSLQDGMNFVNLAPSGPTPSGSAHPFVHALSVSSLGWASDKFTDLDPTM